MTFMFVIFQQIYCSNFNQRINNLEEKKIEFCLFVGKKIVWGISGRNKEKKSILTIIVCIIKKYLRLINVKKFKCLNNSKSSLFFLSHLTMVFVIILDCNAPNVAKNAIYKCKIRDNLKMEIFYAWEINRNSLRLLGLLTEFCCIIQNFISFYFCCWGIMHNQPYPNI